MSWLSDIDPTYSQGWLGKKLGSGGVEFSREVVGTSVFLPTGGGLLLPSKYRDRVQQWAGRGFTTGLVFGATRNPFSTAHQVEANAGSPTSTSVQPTGTGSFQPPTQPAAFDLGSLVRNPIFLVVVALLALLFLSGGRTERR